MIAATPEFSCPTLKVLFASGIYPPDIGGPATYVSQLAAELRKRGGDAQVVTYGEPVTVDDEGNVPVTRIARTSPLPLRYLHFFRAVAAEAAGADLVYLQDALSSGFPGALASRLRGKPVLVKIVGDPTWEIAREKGIVSDDFEVFQTGRYTIGVEAMRRARNFVVRSAARVVVPSQFLARVVEGWGFPRAHIEIVRNSVRDESFPVVSMEVARRRLGLHDARTTVLSIGRLVPWKGFDALIRLAAEMSEDFPDLRWIIVGGGPCEQELKALAGSLGVDDRVTFTGAIARDKVGLYLAAIDLFVLWTGYEGLSHVLIEAMRTGVPVVASDAGGNSELVEDGVSGRLVPWGNTEKLREVVEELCKNPASRKSLGAAGRRESGALSWDTMLERTLDVFERTIQQCRES